jgi:hypothetical protein
MSALSANPGDGADWETFQARPALYAEPSRIAACFGGQFAPDLCARLQTAPRLERRLSDRLRAHYALAAVVAPGAVDEADRTIALAPAAQLVELARHCRRDPRAASRGHSRGAGNRACSLCAGES